ncbi:DUF2189 domain-containing protein [Dechloromonas hortensis]|uniref:DUF2189 domain-containing protein n=1 Tax=Dechloromonas hortensis TaxID=337779 RepID=UPI001292221A|nr:DUF2189 domain-containing protein [Dechloromonas hortensis]
MRPHIHLHLPGVSLPAIRQVGWDRPFSWLMAGVDDLKANPLPSLAYGLLFALGGDLIILATLRYPYLVTVAISGFFLVAPLLAAGLYELSRQTARGKKPLFIDSLRCYRRNGQSLAMFGLLIALAVVFWERFSAIAFALLGPTSSGDTGIFLSRIIFSGEHDLFALTWLALGGLLALLVFALSVISVPMMLDQESDFVTAMATSLQACLDNPGPLLLWAAIIVALTLVGFATALFGLILIMPILGHASWHAYRELVE